MKLSKIYTENRLLTLLAVILVIMVGLPVLVLIELNKTMTAEAWYNDDWGHRKPITVSNDTGSTLSNEDVLVTVDTASLIAEGKMQTDCDDLRFLDSDDSTSLDFWIEGGCNTSTTEVWVQIPSLPSEGKTIYMYYANDSATSESLTWAGNLIMYADTSCPAGWTRASDLDGKFLYGSDTYGSTGGADSHSHGNVSATSSSISTTNIAGSSSSGTSGATTDHTHTGLEASVDSANSLPPYKEVVLCYKDDFNIPSGLISMFNTSAPSGWTRFSALDNLFVRANTAYGATGGSDTHSHSANGGVVTGTNSESQDTITAPFSGTGGTTYTSGGDTIHKFTSSGTFTANKSGTVEVLVVGGGAGGGSGSYQKDGGGGAGGCLYRSSYSISSGSHSVTVGSGGSANHNGGNSSIASLTAIGGGHGGARSGQVIFAQSGGCGGGGAACCSSETIGGSGTTGQGYAGGSTSGGDYPGGGGGCGGPGSSTGNGGTGKTYSISGSSVCYGGGGAGELSGKTANCGGGSYGQNGTANTGGGGAGGNHSGGSGIVIVRYTTPASLSGSIGASSHTHTSSATTTSTDSNLPPYLDMVFAKADDTTYVTSDNVVPMTSLPPLGWNRFTELDNKFPRAAETYGGTGGSATHTHTVEISTGGPSATLNAYGSGINFADSTHTHSASVATDSQSNLPSYTTVIYSQRNDSQTTILGAEESPVPNAPTAQSATPTSTTEITWNFTDNSSDETGFKVYDTSDVLKVTCGSSDISSCLESSLTENTQYSRKFTAFNDAGDSQFSDTVHAYTKASTVSIVSGTSTVDSITLESSTFANPTSGSSAYYFDCIDSSCDTGINEWIQTESDIATGLANNTGYEFRVKNRNGDGVENSYSAEQEIWTKADIPTVASTDITDTTITLQGQGVNNYSQGSSGFYFDCTAGNECDSGVNEWVSTDTDTVVGLNPDTQYSFKVKARNYNGVETAYSANTVTEYTHSTQPSISTVNNATTSTLDLTVDNHDNPSSTQYLVEEVNTANYLNSSGNLVVDPVWLTYDQLGSTSGITINGLDSNTEYTFRVKAKNQSDVETSYSDPVSEYTQLTAPTTETPSSKTDSAITWEISTTETGYDGIKVYDTEDTLITTCIGADITECEETSLNPNTEYTRKLTIYSTHSESQYSSTISERTYAQPVSISLSSPINYYEISLAIDLADNPVGTNLEIFEVNSSKYYDNDLGILVEGEDSFESTTESVTVSGLDPNIEYIFKVRAIDENGNTTDWSTTSSVRTLSQPPNIVSSLPLSRTSGRLTIDLKENPAGTRIAIFEQGGKYVTESGTFSDTEQIFILNGDSIDISGLTANTTYTFKARTYNEDNVASDWSSNLDLVTLIENPTVEITNQTSDSITLTISGISNISQGNSGVYVEDIGQWSNNLTQTVTNLDPNTSYKFSVKVRNAQGVETSYTESPSGYTSAAVPSISEIESTSTTTAVLSVDLGNNPDSTRISIKEIGSGKYLNLKGQLQSEEKILNTDSLDFNIINLSPNTTYTFKVKGYNEEDIATTYSEGQNVTTLVEEPIVTVSNITSSSIDLTISGVSNISHGNSSVFVERLNSWSKSLSRSITDLNPNTSYTFRVRARNKEGQTTSYISTDSIQTLAKVPRIASVNKISANSARVYLDTNENPSYTQMAIRDRISGQYVNANGQLQDDPVWQTYSQWGGGLGQYVTGLDGLRQVGFEVKARNQDGIETSFSNAEYIGTGSVIKNAPSAVSLLLKDNEEVDLSTEAQLGIKDIKLKKDDYMVADLKVSFEQDRDWFDIVIDTDTQNSKTVVKLDQKHGVTEPFTMYVVRNDTNAFRLCPEAQSLDEVREGCIGEQLLIEDFPQEIVLDENIITVSEAKIDGVYYWIADGLTGTGGMGERLQEEQDQEQEQEPVISKISRKVSDTANRVSKDIVLGTNAILDNTPIGELNDEQLTTAVATTTTVTITVGVASTGFVQSFYLVFHFINSILSALGFKRKKKPFGYVYDSSSKEPISNAVVRIYQDDSLVETTVTDNEGMFLSNLEKGEYSIEVKRSGYLFPTELIKGKEDYPLKNIYKGETLKKVKTSDVIVNIPIDKKELRKGKKIFMVLRSMTSIFLTGINILLFVFGVLLMIYTYYKSPDSFSWYIPLLYIPALYFLTTAIFSKRSVYGKVLDKDRNPVVDKEIYLVDKEFGKVAAKRVTDEKGRYRFVCKKGHYQIKVDGKIVLDDIEIKKNGYILAKGLILK
jgi:hypothetical protein